MSSAFDPFIGVALLARGDKEGLARFGATQQAFLSSLAPLLAFPVVGFLLQVLTGDWLRGAAALLVAVVALLAPPVLSHALAVRWGRGEPWLRYATAFNWCQWAVPLAAVALLVLLRFAAAFGLPDTAAVRLLILGLAGYGLWLHWTIARHGLSLSRWRAAGLVLLVNSGTVGLMLGPALLVMLLG